MMLQLSHLPDLRRDARRDIGSFSRDNGADRGHLLCDRVLFNFGDLHADDDFFFRFRRRGIAIPHDVADDEQEENCDTRENCKRATTRIRLIAFVIGFANDGFFAIFKFVNVVLNHMLTFLPHVRAVLWQSDNRRSPDTATAAA